MVQGAPVEVALWVGCVALPWQGMPPARCTPGGCSLGRVRGAALGPGARMSLREQILATFSNNAQLFYRWNVRRIGSREALQVGVGVGVAQGSQQRRRDSRTKKEFESARATSAMSQGVSTQTNISTRKHESVSV